MCRSSALASLTALLVRTTSALTRLTIPVVVEFCVLIFLRIIIPVFILRSAVLGLAKFYGAAGISMEERLESLPCPPRLSLF